MLDQDQQDHGPINDLQFQIFVAFGLRHSLDQLIFYPVIHFFCVSADTEREACEYAIVSVITDVSTGEGGSMNNSSSMVLLDESF